MNQDKLIAMAKEAGLPTLEYMGASPYYADKLQAFANLIRKDQIERDAGICESIKPNAYSESDVCAEAIRNQEVE
jgi:hypothetical protein